MSKTGKPELKEILKLLESKNSMEYEEGFHWIINDVDLHLEVLIARMVTSSTDEIRSRYIELIGNSKNDKVINILETELYGTNQKSKEWAYTSLLNMDNEKANKIASKFKEDNPCEDFI